MRNAIIHIDRAIKDLHNLDLELNAEDFIVEVALSKQKVANADLQGTLYIFPEGDDLELGIFLSEKVRRTLAHYEKWRTTTWNGSQLQAFTVAVEEISHFHYLIHHAHQNRPVSQLALELQGEVDKFLVTYFARLPYVDDREVWFESLYEKLFENFTLASGLSVEQKVRYLEANTLARRFIKQCQSWLLDSKQTPAVLSKIRRFYRLDMPEKQSFLAA